MYQARARAKEVDLSPLASADFPYSAPPDPGWASISRGVLVCDECCSVHRSLGRHISIVKHLRHSAWPPTLLQVGPETVLPSVQCPSILRHTHTHLFIIYSFQGQQPPNTEYDPEPCHLTLLPTVSTH